MPRLRIPVVAFLFAFVAAPVRADDAKALEHFETKIRPVLVEHCVSCHSADAEKRGKLRGGLKLDTKAGWQKGGDTGAAIVSGKPEQGTDRKSTRLNSSHRT